MVLLLVKKPQMVLFTTFVFRRRLVDGKARRARRTKRGSFPDTAFSICFTCSLISAERQRRASVPAPCGAESTVGHTGSGNASLFKINKPLNRKRDTRGCTGPARPQRRPTVRPRCLPSRDRWTKGSTKVPGFGKQFEAHIFVPAQLIFTSALRTDPRPGLHRPGDSSRCFTPHLPVKSPTLAVAQSEDRTLWQEGRRDEYGALEQATEPAPSTSPTVEVAIDHFSICSSGLTNH